MLNISHILEEFISSLYILNYKVKGTKPTNLFIKNYFDSYMFKLQSPSKWLKSILMSFTASAIFCFTSWHQQNFSLSGIFSSREIKISLSGHNWVNREGGTQGSCHFWSKTEHAAWCGQVHSEVIHHEIGKCVDWVSKKIHWSQTQPFTKAPAGPLIRMGS